MGSDLLYVYDTAVFFPDDHLSHRRRSKRTPVLSFHVLVSQAMPWFGPVRCSVRRMCVGQFSVTDLGQTHIRSRCWCPVVILGPHHAATVA